MVVAALELGQTLKHSARGTSRLRHQRSSSDHRAAKINPALSATRASRTPENYDSALARISPN
jgi:hypothetical protein